MCLFFIWVVEGKGDRIVSWKEYLCSFWEKEVFRRIRVSEKLFEVIFV